MISRMRLEPDIDCADDRDEKELPSFEVYKLDAARMPERPKRLSALGNPKAQFGLGATLKGQHSKFPSPLLSYTLITSIYTLPCIVLVRGHFSLLLISN